MLDRLFMRVLDMSRVAGVVILVVLLARFCLKRAPKAVSYALWAVVLFRLLCPLSVKAPVSIVPRLTPTARGYSLADEPISPAGAGFAAYRAMGDALNGGLGIQHIPTTQTDETGEVRYVSSSWREVWILFGQYVWAAGMAGMLLHSAVSCGKLRRKLKTALPLRDNIYLVRGIRSPFVIGLFCPRICLPCGLGEGEQRYIILHEQYHIERRDPLCKALAYLALCIHWFNPLVWLAFALAEKDMEMSCDEAVVRRLGAGIRAEYAASLLSLAAGRRTAAGTSLAFGEGNAKARIRNLGRWKQPALWTVAAAAAAGLVLTVCLGTDPEAGGGTPRELGGVVTEVQTDENGRLSAAVIRTGEGSEAGILFTQDTAVFPPEGGVGTAQEQNAAFQAALRPDLMIFANCDRGKKMLTTGGGARIAAYTARTVWVTGEVARGAVSLADGTRLDVAEDRMLSCRTYRLADGTELLRADLPFGPDHIRTDGTEAFDGLGEAARERVLAWYEQRGPLYDEQAELEKAYALYQSLGADFRPGRVEQCVSPAAWGRGVVYFLTSVTRPTGRENGNILQETRLCDAFDRETGAHIDTWSLFTAPREEVIQALLDACGITEQPLRGEMEAASWEGRIEFSPDGLSVLFEPGLLPGEEDGCGFFAELTPDLLQLMQEWAAPQGRGEN